MSKWNRRSLAVVVGIALLLGVSCTSSTDGPAGPSAEPQAAVLAPVITPVVSPVAGAAEVLTCQPLPYASTTVVVGPEGGAIRVGKYRLLIPRGALASRMTIKAEQVPGSLNSVRFSPEGLKFARPAQLTMSYDNCLVVLPAKRIVYMSEQLKVLEVLRSLDLQLGRVVTAPIDHFSRYAVAY